MADTGAPYFIPFADPTDLVRDWPALSEDVADAVAAGLTAAGNAGIGSNVVQTVLTGTFSSTSTSFVDITGFTATITPSSNTAKVLVIAQLQVSNSAGTGGASRFQLRFGSTDIYSATGGVSENFSAYNLNTNQDIYSKVLVFLHSPNDDTAVTYSAQMRVDGGSTGFVNRRGNVTATGVPSSLTLIEVAP